MANLEVANQIAEGSSSQTPETRDMAPTARKIVPAHGPAMFRNFNAALPPVEKHTISPDRKLALGLGRAATPSSSSRVRDESQTQEEPLKLDAREMQTIAGPTDIGDSLQQTQNSVVNALRSTPEEMFYSPSSGSVSQTQTQQDLGARMHPPSAGSGSRLRAQDDIFGPRLIDTHGGSRAGSSAGSRTRSAGSAQQNASFDRVDQAMTEPWFGSERNPTSDRSRRSPGSRSVGTLSQFGSYPQMPERQVGHAVTVSGPTLSYPACVGTYVRSTIEPNSNHAGRVIFKGPGSKYLFYWSSIRKWIIGEDYNSQNGWYCSSESEGWCPTQVSAWREYQYSSGLFKPTVAMQVRDVEAMGKQDIYAEDRASPKLASVARNLTEDQTEPGNPKVLLLAEAVLNGSRLEESMEKDEQKDLKAACVKQQVQISDTAIKVKPCLLGEERKSPVSSIPSSPSALKRSMTERFKVTKQALFDFVEMDVQAQQSCRSLPFTIAFWLVFVITQLSHRQVSLAYEIQSFTSSLLEDQVEIVAYSSNVSTSRRLTTSSGSSGSTGSSGSGGVSGASGSSGTARAGEVTDEGLTLDSVTSLPGIYDWIDRSLVRLTWNDQSAAGVSYVSSFNRVIGGARLQQTRLATDTCPGEEDFKEFFNARCYSRSKTLNGTALNPLFEGFSAGDGDVFTYWLDIYQTMDETLEHTTFLQGESWLDIATHQVTAQLALYNEQVALFSFAETVFNIDLSGKLEANTKVKVLPTQVYDSVGTLLGDGIMMAMLGWLAIGEIIKMWHEPFSKYITPYAVLNWTLVLQGCGLVAFFAWLTTSLDRLEDDIWAVTAPPKNTTYLPGSHSWDDRHQKLDVLYDHMRALVGYMNAAEFITFAYTMVMVFKFFEAFHGNPRLALLTQTFYECVVDVAHFLVVFLTIFSNFALGGYFMFGNQLNEWSNLSLAFMTTFRSMMGDFEFSSMYAIAPVSSTIWFISFMVLVFLVMLNMLLAIIMDVYDRVKEQSRMHMSLADQTLHLLHNVKMRTSAWMRKRSLAGDFKQLQEIARDESLDAEPICVDFLTSRGLDKSFAETILKRVPESKNTPKLEGDESKAKVKHDEAVISREVVTACQQLLERVVNLQASENTTLANPSLAVRPGPPSMVSSPLLPDAVPEISPELVIDLPRIAASELPGSIRADGEEYV